MAVVLFFKLSEVEQNVLGVINPIDMLSVYWNWMSPGRPDGHIGENKSQMVARCAAEELSLTYETARSRK